MTVLDVGCGPGTNTSSFTEKPEYLGVDLNEKYIDYARKRHGRQFRVADVTTDIPSSETFDLILVNSLMHHLDDDGAQNLIGSLPSLLSPGGQIHILDLVLSPSGIPRKLALADRGKYPRPVDEWRELVDVSLTVEKSSSFYLTLAGIRLWEMIHIAAAAKR